MEGNDPIKITSQEWLEIMRVPDVCDAWGLQDWETVEDFKGMVYGVKFNFQSGSPGYYGDLYILQGNGLNRPIRLIRKNGKLIMLAEDFD
jgi:hypothetical protein